MNLKTWCADRRDHWLARAAEHRKAGMVRSADAAGGRAEAFAVVAAQLEDHDPQDTVDALALDAASLVDCLNTALREAGADVPQLQDVDLVKAKHAMMALVDAERRRAAEQTAAALQTEALVAELKARGAVAIEWAADDGVTREEL